MVHSISESWAFIGLSGWKSLLLISISNLMCFYLFLFLYSYFSRIWGSNRDKFIQFVVFNRKFPFLFQPTATLLPVTYLDLLQGACLNVPRLDEEPFLCSLTGSFAWLYHNFNQTVLKVSISMPDSLCRLFLLVWGCVLVMSISSVPSIWSTVVQSKYEAMGWMTIRINQNSQRDYLEREISLNATIPIQGQFPKNCNSLTSCMCKDAHCSLI